MARTEASRVSLAPRRRAAAIVLGTAAAIGLCMAALRFLPALRDLATATPVLDPAEARLVLALGPWPPAVPRDPSNRVSGQPAAVSLGEALFHSPRLSRVAGVRCASCHEPWRRFTDALSQARGAATGERNTPTLLNVATYKSFGWDGARQTLWSQSLRPMLDRREMQADAAWVADIPRHDAGFHRLYLAAFGHEPPGDDEAVMVDLAKALAAYEETLRSGPTPFDAFRDRVELGDARPGGSFPAPALRGLKLFIGDGGCVRCHSGPAFSDGRLHLTLVRPPSVAKPQLVSLQERPPAQDPYGLGGRYDDSPSRPGPTAAPTPARSRLPDEIRTPGLREAAVTGPWMHDGSVATLCEAVDRHAQDQPALRDPRLREDLVAFLRTLATGPDAPWVEEASLHCR